MLDSGVAEIHQHVGAGMGFRLLWASALAAIATTDVQEDELESPGAPFSDGKYLVRWLLAAAIARCTLDALATGDDDRLPDIHALRDLYAELRTVVQRPMTGGLQWFIRFYGRLGKLRDPIYPILVEASYQIAGERLPIRALELRTSPVSKSPQVSSPCVTGALVRTFVSRWPRDACWQSLRVRL